MDRRAWFRADDGEQCSSEHAGLERLFTPGLSWRAVRWEYARTPKSDEPVLNGVGWLLFGIGIHGTGWLTRLGQSAWFAGLEPRPADLGHGMDAHGHRPMPGLSGGTVEDDLATEMAAFVASASMPSAWCAAVAVPSRIGPAECAIVLGLVNTLRARRDPLGRQLTVMVTMDDAGPSGEVLADRLRERGAFVVRGGSGEAAGDHLHHYPLRATTRPRDGRLICVDFADFLHTWQPGRHATLRTIPRDLEADHGRRGCALNMLFHADMNDPALSLFEIDRLASELIERRLGADGDAVFTTSDRLDGRTGTVDLLVIEPAPNPGEWAETGAEAVTKWCLKAAPVHLG